MKCARCPGLELREGGALGAHTCDRCGGGLVPDDGAQRLLVEELGHDQAQLKELASLVAGARLACPSCRGLMSPIKLRGALLDLCFQCGALWVDAGELERVSASRYVLPPARAPQAVTHVQPTQALVRIDDRPPWVRSMRNVLWFYSGFGVAAALFGSPLAPTLVFTVPTLWAAVALTRRHAVDLLPRARRVRRWRGVFPPDRPALDEELPTDAVAVLSPLRGIAGRWLRRLDLVDGEGRVIVTLRHVVSERDATRAGLALSHALGVPLRSDVQPISEPLELKPAVFPDASELVVQPDDVPQPGMRRLRIQLQDGTPIGWAKNERRAPDGHRPLGAVLADDWVITDPDGRVVVRLLPSRRWGQLTSLVLTPEGALYGHVRVRRTFFFEHVEWASPARRRVLALSARHGTSTGDLRDHTGAWRGAVHVITRPGGAATVSVSHNPAQVVGATRVGLVAALVHMSLTSLSSEL